ncbi:hypothetical protein [Halobacterium sp. KA-6]|uniref:hypothetical protein n=1 Tax=Halobacterium sp. KA-6 TaxID=2896368 RepID=UPI001E6579AC|nr:hypothetical protein [Halobacterium sp. KA-6]MCD2203342.1 hypothetical protein [Halobacterium sp. KA-6]
MRDPHRLIIDGSEGHVVVVVGDGAPVVHADTSLELGFAYLLSIFEDAVFAVTEGVGGEVVGRLDETGLQTGLLPNSSVGLFVARVLRILDFCGVVAPSSVSNVLGRLTELLERLIENAVSTLGNVKL